MLSDECPILSLPDEVLCHVLSFITEIPFKMSLESVCKRFNSISTNQKNSWKGNDLLEIIIGAPLMNDDLYSPPVKFLAKYCSVEEIENGHYLNTCKVPLPLWPKAIEQLLQRTVIRKLCIHMYDEDDYIFQIGESKLFLRAFAVIRNHPKSIRLNHIEFQNIELELLNKVRRALDPVVNDLYFWAVSNSAKTLHSIMLYRQFRKFPNKQWTHHICSGVRACSNLKSFVFNAAPADCRRMMRLSEALQGKPLERLVLRSEVSSTTRLTGDKLAEFLLPISASLTTLTFDSPVDIGETHRLIDFAAFLHPSAAQTLVDLSIYNVFSLDSILPALEHLPAVFPNLRIVHLFDPRFLDIGQDYVELENENLLLNSHFFATCNQTPAVSRKVVISVVLVKDVDGFEARMTEFCEREQIRAVFAEEEEDEDGLIKMGSITLNYSNPYVTMTKGQGTIVIIGITQTHNQEMDIEIDIDDDY